MTEKANPEAIKYPSNKAQYDKNYVNIFGRPCSVCKTKGYLEDLDRHGKIIKTACLLCNGTGRRVD